MQSAVDDGCGSARGTRAGPNERWWRQTEYGPVSVSRLIFVSVFRPQYTLEPLHCTLWDVPVATWRFLIGHAIIDVNRLGQSGPTMLQHYMDVHRARWEAFGWHAMVVDGHDISALLQAFAEAGSTKGKPAIILAETLKGKGMDGYEDKNGWHGKPLPKDEAERVVGILEKSLTGEGDNWTPNLPERRRASEAPSHSPGAEAALSASAEKKWPRARRSAMPFRRSRSLILAWWRLTEM
jgi:hypothetical protein